MNGMFNSITSIGSYLYIISNTNLRTITNSFTSLQSVNSNL